MRSCDLSRKGDPDYIFARAYPLQIEGWEAYWLQLPAPSGKTEALGVVAARRHDLPIVPRVFVVEPSGGEPILVEWRYDSRIRYRGFDATEEGLTAMVVSVLADSRHPPKRVGAPLLRAPPAPDPSWWSNQPEPEKSAPAAPATAALQAPTAPTDQAAVLMGEGTRLLRSGQAHAAIGKLEASLRLRPEPTVAKHLAAAHVKLGNHVEARAVLQTYDTVLDVDNEPIGYRDSPDGTLGCAGIFFTLFGAALTWGSWLLISDPAGFMRHRPCTVRGQWGQWLIEAIGAEVSGIMCGIASLGFVGLGGLGVLLLWVTIAPSGGRPLDAD